jgi:tetratricopeptide (TPR) repeat protein
MKYGILLLLAILTINAKAQTIDSLTIKQVDSLILVSRDLTAQKDYDKALEVNAAAEKIALEKLGRESAAFGSCAFNRGRVNDYKGDYSEAEIWYLNAIDIREKVLGKEHLDYAASLNNLAILYFRLGNYEKAEAYFLELKEIREKILDREHPDYATSLNNLGGLYWNMGKYEKAEAYFLESKEIREKTLGRAHPDYAGNLYNLAKLYRAMGSYDIAEPLYLESKSIWESLYGKEHPQYEFNVNELAYLYTEMNLYEKAKPLYYESLALRKIIYGKDHLYYSKVAINLANLYFEIGDYKKAETLFIEVIQIRQRSLGVNHPDYASSLNNLANLHARTGNYDKAEHLYLEANAIWANTLGEDDPRYAGSLSNLGNLYKDMGNYKKAEEFHLQAKSIREKAYGIIHPDYAASLESLGLLYHNMGTYSLAEQHYVEAKSILETTLGIEHYHYSRNLNNLAVLYWRMGRYDKAEYLLLEAKSIRENIYGKESIPYAAILINLGNVYQAMEQNDKAEQLYRTSKMILENTVGSDHPDFIDCLKSLANLLESQKRYLESEPLLNTYVVLARNRLSKSVAFLSTQELTEYTTLFQGINYTLSSYLYTRMTAENHVGILPQIVFNQSLFSKGFLLNAANRQIKWASSIPEVAIIYNDFKDYRRRIAAEISKPFAEQLGVSQMEDKANILEKQLARSLAGYEDAMRQVQWQDVQAALSMDAAALEFVHFRVNFPQSTDSTMYAALLLRSGAAQPEFIPLFEEKELDHLLDGDRERKADYVNELYAWADRGMVQLGSAKKSLYDLIWAKIESAGLDGIKTIYYSPSGVLHRLNLGAIAVDDETILADKYNLVALNSTRQLVILSSVSTQENDALLVGGVNFELDSILDEQQEEPVLAIRSTAEAWIESGTRGGSWSYLKWTEKEVERIASTLNTGGFKADQLTGAAASEEVIKGIGAEGPSPRILHIATHGFFFPDPEQTPSFRRGMGEAEPVFKSSDNPMIRSGLILAGGNYAWQHGRAVSPDKEDGILTAYEISQMNLANTELVVLSACETGLGDIQGNEGVYGLQRAFKIAGAKYLIMSLWQVPDRETMEFMTTFYRNWLEEKMTIPDAFRKTQGEMRDRFYNPYSWAGFVLVE